MAWSSYHTGPHKLPWDARAHSVARSRRSRAEMFDKQIGNRASKEETTPIDARAAGFRRILQLRL